MDQSLQVIMDQSIQGHGPINTSCHGPVNTDQSIRVNTNQSNVYRVPITTSLVLLPLFMCLLTILGGWCTKPPPLSSSIISRGMASSRSVVVWSLPAHPVADSRSRDTMEETISPTVRVGGCSMSFLCFQEMSIQSRKKRRPDATFRPEHTPMYLRGGLVCLDTRDVVHWNFAKN